MGIFRKIVGWCELPSAKGATKDELYLSNEDLRPIVKEKRTWGSWTYGLYWLGAESQVITWTIASTGVTSGLSWWEAWLCVIIGQSFNSLFVTANGRPGAVYHIGFPVVTRASFGVWGSYWPVLNRSVPTIIWAGVQLVTAGGCFYVALHAIFPGIAAVGPALFGPDVTMTGGRLIGFVIAWTSNIAATYFEIHRLKGLIMIKFAVMLVCLVAFLVWACQLAGGIGPIVRQGSNIPPDKSHAWVFISTLFIMAANEVTFSVNASDTTRYARRPNDALWAPLICHPLAAALVSIFGILITSSSSVILGELVWDPITILDRYLTLDYTASRRAGVFFIALGLGFSQAMSNVLENLVAAGNDTAALFPRFCNIRRGAVFVICLAFIINPWQLSNTRFTFTNYLGSYQIFLSSVLGVVLCDYFFVRKGFLQVDHLFTSAPSGIYYYRRGWNWRAYVAYVAGMVPVFPGFLDSLGVRGVPRGAVLLFYMALPVGILVAAAVYYPLCLWSPPPGGVATAWYEDVHGQWDLVGPRRRRRSESIEGVEAVEIPEGNSKNGGGKEIEDI